MSTQDPQADDDTADDGQAEEAEPGPVSDEERIGQITVRIDKARAKAEEAGVPVEEGGEEFVESGATEDEDDQTITPPG